MLRARHQRPLQGVVLAVMFCAMGCDTQGEAEAVEVQEQLLAVDKNWVGFDVGLRPPRLVKKGKVEFAPLGTVQVPPPSPPPDPEVEFIESEGVTSLDAQGNMYDVQFSKAEQETLVKALQARGLVGAPQLPNRNFVESAMVPFDHTKGLPNAVDNRVVWGMGSNGTGGVGYPQSTQGRFSTTLGLCSATLFDNRLIVMAAHCWFSYPGNNGSGTWGGNPTFQAGLSTSGTPYGTLGFDPAYAGSVYTSFINNNCHKTYTTACIPIDISWMALSSTPTDSGGTTAGAMGYATGLPSNQTYFLSGYPGCGSPDSPAQCPNTLYFAPSNWPSGGCTRTSVASNKFNTNCGASPGQSGGPFFYYQDGSLTAPHITGVAAFEYCSSASCAGVASPIAVHRLTSNDFNFMQSLNSMF